MADNIFDINTDTMLRYGVGGLAGGASIGLILNLMREFKDKKKEHEQKEDENDNVFTVTLPADAPEEVEEIEEVLPELLEGLTDEELEYFPGLGKESFLKVKGKDIKPTKETEKVTLKKMKAPTGQLDSADTKSTKTSKGSCAMSAKMNGQSRHYDGQFGKSANWETLAASILALTGAGYAGLKGVDAIFDSKRQGELEDELDEARMEYQAKLQDALGKTAGAGSDTFRWGDYPIALSALALLVGGGSTAYLTKKVMDSINKEPKSDFDRPKGPEIKRIVFKTKEASALSPRDTADLGIAMLGVYTDAFTKSADVISDHEVASKLANKGWTPKSIYKAAYANEEFDRLQVMLAQNPDIRNAMKRATMDKHPILKYLKWGADLPFVTSITDAKLYDSISEQMGPAYDSKQLLEEMRPKLAMAKCAAIMGVAPLVTSAIGSAIANEVDESMEERISEQQKEEQGSEISIDGLDPAAEEYIREHRDEIEAILKAIDDEAPAEKQALGDYGLSRGAGRGILRSAFDMFIPSFIKDRGLIRDSQKLVMREKGNRNLAIALGLGGTGIASTAFALKNQEHERLLNDLAMSQALGKYADSRLEKNAGFLQHARAFRGAGKGGFLSSWWDAAKKAHLLTPGVQDAGLVDDLLAKGVRDRNMRNLAYGLGGAGTLAGGYGLYKGLSHDNELDSLKQYAMMQDQELAAERAEMDPLIAGGIGALLGTGIGVGGKTLYDNYVG